MFGRCISAGGYMVRVKGVCIDFTFCLASFCATVVWQFGCLVVFRHPYTIKETYRRVL